MNDPRGSIWRKWDLHLHTPASYDYENKTVTTEVIVAKLKEEEIAAVAITDHNVIDVEMVREFRSLAGSELTVFPGIELRSELGGTEWVHFTGIFPEDCDLDDIWTKIQGKLNLTRADREKIGDDAIYVPIKKAADLVYELDGLVVVHAGKKSNSIENIANDEKHKMRLKKDLVDSSIDILEIGVFKDIGSYKEKVFPDIKMELPLIICSDNHDIRNYELDTPCWIKADTTIAGLKQVLNEPEERIRIDKIPPELANVFMNPTKFIKEINIGKIENSDLTDIWFDNKLVLNYSLVAVIGNKGSGKSALADTIGLLGNSKNEKYFSFLHKDKFRDPKGNLSEHFEAKLTWVSDRYVGKRLSDHISTGAPETVKCIPQKFLEKVCTQIAGGEESLFERELEEAVFSHVDESERLGKTTLGDLLSYKTEEIREKIDVISSGIEEDNRSIALLEERTTSEQRKEAEGKSRLKEEELRAHEKIKPAKRSKPKAGSKEQEKATKNIENVTKELNSLGDQRKEAQERVSSSKSQISRVDKVLGQIDTFRLQYENLKEKSSEVLKSFEIEFEDVVSFSLNTTPLTVLKNSLLKEKEEAEDLLDEDKQGSLIAEWNAKQERIKGFREQLNKPQKEYEEYLENLSNWEDKRRAIKGSVSTPDTIEYYRKQIEEIDGIPEQLDELYSNRLAKTNKIFSEIKRLVEIYRELYAPVQAFIAEQHLISKKLDLKLDVSIQESGFESVFFDFINQGKVGSFHGIDEGRAVLKGILTRYDFNSWDNARAFIEEIVEHLWEDKSGKRDSIKKTFIGGYMKKDKAVSDLYDFIFSLNYLKPRFVLKLGEKEMRLLSPGERGAVLLIFYMLVEKSDIPFIIDQPEDNLDNETIYTLLVPCIKEAKKGRQIFLVTHNPNLAVVCDAEQVIRASHDKEKKNPITYNCGAIENPEINKAILDVLEGTKYAFENRRSKYQTLKK